MKHSTQYLYGIEPSEFKSLPYSEALHFKYLKANDLIHTLMEPGYRDRDDERISAAFEAIRFNRALIEELS